VRRFEALAGRSDKDVRYGPTRRSPISDIVQKSISPELVLVDSELRSRLLAQQLEELLLEALLDSGPRSVGTEPATSFFEPVEPVSSPVAPMPLSVALQRSGESAARPRRKRRLSPALLSVSLAVNVIVVALSVSDARIAHTSPSSPLAIDPPAPDQLAPTRTKPPSTKKALRASARATQKTRKSRPGVPKRPAAMARATRGKAEQKVLNTVIQSPAKKLPRALIDSKTGLAKNGLQALCRPDGPRSFLCVVQPARHRPREGLYVRYYPNRGGRAAFTWYRYRRG
jgi:hypothetical protein